MHPVSPVIFRFCRSDISKKSCCVKMYFATLPMVSLNMESMGKNANTSIMGTVMDVAIIWFLLNTPAVAPNRKEQQWPTNITSRNRSKSFPPYPPAIPMTREPTMQMLTT